MEKWVNISSSINPLSFFRFICQRMAFKVLHQQYSSKQSLISGSLALLMLIMPLLIVIYLLHQFASYQWLLDILLLWILMQFTDDVKTINKGLEALHAGKNQLAKDYIQQKLLRNTQSLSTLGLVKASGESIFLRYHHQQFTTILCYVALGPIAALGYRLCYEASQMWNVKRKPFYYFGRPANAVTQAFQVIPSLLMTISFVLTSSPTSLLLHVKQKKLVKSIYQSISLQSNQSLLLQTLSSAVNINTGGPVIYGKVKIQRTRFVFASNENLQLSKPRTSAEPTIDSIKTLITLINRHLIVSVLIITWIMFWYSTN